MEAVLIDAGLSCRETERRMKKAGLAIEKLKAIFISHEHSDHITGLSGLSKKYQLPVYITPTTLNNTSLPIEAKLIQSFSVNKPSTIGSLTITAFTKWHDASDPHSFMISDNGINVGVITDIGHACKEVIKHFKQCHAAFLESNYCEEMLEKGNYPIYLKNRIRGQQGHLSNTQALELFLKHRSPQLTHLILAHLSKNNNDPELVHRLFTENADNVSIIVASRYTATPVFNIENNNKIKNMRQKRLVSKTEQLSLF
jgi:phosphoribosyl 1,2-cyclic phosphodiesterase